MMSGTGFGPALRALAFLGFMGFGAGLGTDPSRLFVTDQGSGTTYSPKIWRYASCFC